MKPASIDINGRIQVFEPGYTDEGQPKTLVVASRLEPIFTHTRFVEEKVVGRIYDHPKLCMYLAGMVLPGMSVADGDDLDALLTGMRDSFGWEADVKITDKIDERIKEKYIRMGTIVVENIVGFPEDWL